MTIAEENTGIVKYKSNLIWDDFKGYPNPNSKFNAYTIWNISYDYTTYPIDLGQCGIIQHPLQLRLNVNVCLDHKSWVKPSQKQRTDLLKHELGHYQIGVLCALEFKKRVFQQSYFQKHSVKEQVNSIFKNCLEFYVELENQYDEETNHCKNKEKQIVWEQYIEQQLELLKQYQSC